LVHSVALLNGIELRIEATSNGAVGGYVSSEISRSSEGSSNEKGLLSSDERAVRSIRVNGSRGESEIVSNDHRVGKGLIGSLRMKLISNRPSISDNGVVSNRSSSLDVAGSSKESIE